MISHLVYACFPAIGFTVVVYDTCLTLADEVGLPSPISVSLSLMQASLGPPAVARTAHAREGALLYRMGVSPPPLGLSIDKLT